MAFNDFASMDMNGILFIGVLLLFALLLMLELFRPFRRFGVQIAKASFVTNTSAFLFNNVVLSLLSASSLFAVADRYSQVGLLAAMDGGIAKGILSFVLFDLVIYLWHAASHRFEPLWRFHKIHHSDKSLNVTTGFRFHVIDLFLELHCSSDSWAGGLHRTDLRARAYAFRPVPPHQRFFRGRAMVIVDPYHPVPTPLAPLYREKRTR